jgi:hypothetical protein
MIFGGLPMISLCHQAILDRRLLGSVADAPGVGVDLAVRNYSSNSVSTTTTTTSPWHQHSKAESTAPDLQIEFGAPKVPFWDRFQANFLSGLLSLRIIRAVEDLNEA